MRFIAEPMTADTMARLIQRPLALATASVTLIAWESAIIGRGDAVRAVSSTFGLVISLTFAFGPLLGPFWNEWGEVTRPLPHWKCALQLAVITMAVVAVGAGALHLAWGSPADLSVPLGFKVALVLACNVAGFAFAVWLQTAFAMVQGHSAG